MLPVLSRLQQFQVVATETVNPVALEANVDCAFATEKLDGTCCYVSLYQGASQSVESMELQIRSGVSSQRDLRVKRRKKKYLFYLRNNKQIK